VLKNLSKNNQITQYYDGNIKVEYSLRESVSAHGREGRGFDSDPGRNKKKSYILSRDSEVTLSHWSVKQHFHYYKKGTRH
jgi:hypothetical protein